MGDVYTKAASVEMKMFVVPAEVRSLYNFFKFFFISFTAERLHYQSKLYTYVYTYTQRHDVLK